MPGTKRVQKFYAAEVKAFNDADLTIEHFISTEVRDRSGDIVRAEGMQLDGVPSVLKQHGFDPDIGAEPIAKCVELRVGARADGAKGIIAKTQYFPDDVGRRLYEKAKGGYMPYWSIGFEIEEARPLQGGGRDIRKWWLYEYSQVGVPDNVTADTIKAFDPATAPAQDVMSGEVTPVSVPPATVLKTVPVPVANVKSLTEALAGRVPMNAIYMAHEEFCYQLAWNTADIKGVRALVKEYTGLVAQYAEAFWTELQALNAEEKTVRIALAKAWMPQTEEATTHPTGQVDRQAAPTDAPAAPAAPTQSVPPAETVPPPEAPAPAPEAPQAVVPAPAAAPEPESKPQGTPIRLALGDTAAPKPATVQLAPGISQASINAAIRAQVAGAFAPVTGRLA